MEDRVSITIEDGVADVRMVRADKMNALDDAMFEALIGAGERMKTERGVRAVVLSGEGRAFCAGLDTGNFQRMATGERRGGAGLMGERTTRGANRAQNAALVWRDVPVPVIAAIHGVAYGGGFQIMLGADLRFSTPDAKMAVMEIQWGLVPDMGAYVLAPRLIREDLFRELTYSGRVFTGEEAQRLGLVTRVCADPRAEALAYAREVAGRNPHAIRAAKRLFDLDPSDPHAVLLAESNEQAALIGSPNQVEAVMAKMQNRPGKFTDPD